jgi:hypothetical protein
VPARRRGEPTPASAVLALQASAGNRAVAQALQRAVYHQKPKTRTKLKNAAEVVKAVRSFDKGMAEELEELLLNDGCLAALDALVASPSPNDVTLANAQDCRALITRISAAAQAPAQQGVVDVQEDFGQQKKTKVKTRKVPKATDDPVEVAWQNLNAAQKALEELAVAGDELVLDCLTFACTDWKNWKAECDAYLMKLSGAMLKALTGICECELKVFTCQIELAQCQDEDFSGWRSAVLKGKERLTLLGPLCTLLLADETWLACGELAASYLETRDSSELTEDVKTQQKTSRSAPLEGCKAAIYKDLAERLGKLVVGGAAQARLKQWSVVLLGMSRQAAEAAKEKSELHAGRSQKSHV